MRVTRSSTKARRKSGTMPHALGELTPPPPTHTVFQRWSVPCLHCAQALEGRMTGSQQKTVPGFCSGSPGSTGAHAALATAEEGTHGKRLWPLGATPANSQVSKAVKAFSHFQRQRLKRGTCFSSSTRWVSGTELSLSDSAVRTFTCWATLLPSPPPHPPKKECQNESAWSRVGFLKQW